MVGIDARDGRVAVEGWLEASETTAVDLGKRFEDAGVAAIVYTDIARDGMLTGPNIPQTAALAEALTIPVIVSGGVATVQDIVDSAAERDEGHLRRDRGPRDLYRRGRSRRSAGRRRRARAGRRLASS